MAFIDRTRVTTDWKCPRARYWAFEYLGRGVSPARRALYFDIGDAVHKSLDALSRGEALDGVCAVHLARFREMQSPHYTGELAWKLEEQVCLIEGMIRGWYRSVLPRLTEEFEVVAIEEEFVYEVAPGLTMGVKPDKLLRRRSDGTLWYRETKTLGYLGKDWSLQWQRAIQLHTTAFIVGAHLQEEVSGVIVEGLYKGYDREGKATSPFAYGYARPGTIRGPEIMPEWRAGCRKIPIWSDYPGGCRAWAASLPTEVLSNQFIETPPIFLQRRLVEAFLRQVAIREEVIRRAAEVDDDLQDGGLLDTVFPQHFSECAPAIGVPCAYADCCFNPVVGEDPVRSGLYTPRVPHHTTEVLP